VTASKSPKKKPHPVKPKSETSATLLTSSRQWHAFVVAVAVLLTVGAYANATQGSFVYDDEFQIVKNPQIKPGGDILQAVTSDVWAFRGAAGEARSNYWRPVFTGWLALNYRLFGLETTGWHVLNILLHLLVSLAVYALLMALRVRPAMSAIAVWLFAAHPAHVQSVTWISGSPDLLMALFLITSMIAYLAARERTHWGYQVAAVSLYALVLLSKETALAFIVILFFTDIILSRDKSVPIKPAAMAALKRSIPFVAVAFIFIVTRYQLLHSMRQLAPDAPALGDVLLTLPAILFFYIRQAFLPFEFSPIYGVRYVDGTNVGVMNFLLPLVVLAALGYAAYRLCRRDKVYRLAVVWFIAPLLPVLDPRIFVSEMLVQDRYLYLPLFGAALLISAGLSELVARWMRDNQRRQERAALATGLVVACLLAVMTLRANPVWASGVALWEQGVRVDSSSAIAQAYLANEYQRAGRLADAKQATTRAIELRPDMTSARLTRGIIAVRERRYEDAERDLKDVLNAFPDYDVAREQLALAYQQQGKLDEAIALFDEGRRLIPAKQSLYTINLAVLYKLAGREQQAQSTLESLLPVLNTTSDLDLLVAWWYLGELYRAQGRADDAANAYGRYLKATEGSNDAQVKRLRDSATHTLQQLKR
jgi:tetratricopeptide (TPR) repeat protein